MAFNIADLLEHAVDLAADRTAVVCGDRRVTFAELEQRANRLAHHLADQGIGPESKVGIYSLNSVEFVETMFALFKLRAVPININYRYVEEELAYIFDDADLEAVVHQRRYAPRMAAVLSRVPAIRHTVVVEDGTSEETGAYGPVEYERALAGASPERDFGERSAGDLYVLYTGGTTGMPKGVVWRQEDVWRVLGGGIDFMTNEPVEDEWKLAQDGAGGGPLVRFPVAPMMHGAAQWAALGALFTASTVVLLPKFDPHEVWRLVDREKVNVMAITGDAMARPMIEAFESGEYDGSTMLALSSGAAIFSPSVKQQYLEVFPNLVITDTIGSSETGFSGLGVVSKDEKDCGGPRVNRGEGTIVIDDDGRPIAPGGGGIGRLARSGHIPLGYHKDPEKTARTFTEINGVRYSIPGDMARVEDDGTIVLLGRGSNCINTGGEKVFPEEVEGAVKSHPDVFDVLVVGAPDERYGQRVVAVVQPREGRQPTLEDVDAHLRTRIAGYKVPRELHLVERVRRHPSGKPDYRWAQDFVRQSAATTAAPTPA
ncbi:MAG TPA: acyl-CoA synthetase [Nocardioidaceae bacterium]|nr:acyl-CoA synthetase [Nocardioidaceae bacterium]